MSRGLGKLSIEFLRAMVDGPKTKAEIGETFGGEEHTAKNYVSRFKAYGYIEPITTTGLPRYKLTAKGREAIGTADARKSEGATGSTRDRALHLIHRELLGLDSHALADRLGVTREEIEDALEEYVKEHRLSTCLVVRGELQCTLYRASMAGTSTMRDARAPAAPEGIAHARAASKPTELPKAAPTAPPPRPGGYSKVIVSSETAASAPVGTKPKLVHAAPETVAAIIASEARKGPTDVVMSRPDGGLLEVRFSVDPEVEDDGFLCYLQSDGVLTITSDEHTIELPPQHALKLSGYLHHVRSIRMLSAIVARGQS